MEVIRMDVIWNLTRACPWDCAICCVSGFHVCNTTEYIIQSSQKERGKELTLAEKLMVLKILAERDFEIDFSGGDPLYYDEDFQVVEQATRWLPSRKIGVSMTGSKITDAKIEFLKKVGIVEFTLDNLSEIKNPFRPRGYNLASMVAMKKCVGAGIKTRAVTVFYPTTMTEKNLESVYRWLCENGISEWELLRFYPVGRAAKFAELTPSNSEYLKAMEFLRGLHGFTKIFFQHSLRILEGIVKCPAAVDSIGILPDGQVIVCAWAIDKNCEPFKGFRLGKLPEDNLDEILENTWRLLEYSERTKFCRTIACIQKSNKNEVI
jgi:MoaA/NifB/PqqE/SkfB family radical SAM enzyme